MILITSAVGDRSREDAARLAASLIQHGWPRLIIHAEEPIEGCECVIADNRGVWGGRLLKAGFARALPADYAGPCIWIDADCEARWPSNWMPKVGPDEVGGLKAQRYFDGQGRIAHLLHSTVLLFGSAEHARVVSDSWAKIILIETKERSTDETALWRSLDCSRCHPLPGNHEWPLPGLYHEGRNSRIVNGRPPL